VMILSADGQDPPEIIPEMIGRFDKGIELVWGERRDRANDPWLRRTMAAAYYRIFRTVTSFDYPPAGFDFVMFTAAVRESILAHRERNTSLFLLLFNLGYGQASVEYDRGIRSAGESGWTFRKRAKLAIDMATGFSAAPIRLVSIGGLVVGIGGLLFGGYTIIRGLIDEVPVSGWASLMVVSSLLGGFTLVAIALIGEYLWRTLDEVRNRPLYLEARRTKVD
jgi:polyisoprenyl-phosphate glycosyltransferase